jgi:hypothetical protein
MNFNDDNLSIKSELSEYSLDDKTKQTIFDKIKQHDNFDDYNIIPTTSPNSKKKKFKELKNNIFKIDNINDTNKRTFNPRLPPYNKRNLSNK